MRLSFFLIFILLQLVAVSQRPYFQQKVDYNIDVLLNDAQHTLKGNESIRYTNNSSDTLYYMWFHLWPNAYKNDKSEFSEQLIRNGRIDFYFCADSLRGFITDLDFKVDGIPATTEQHPDWLDVVKLRLPIPLLPSKTTVITTSFLTYLPYLFSRGGHIAQEYNATQWYPKPAVYDNEGWHPMPLLDQGGTYSEFGDFNVNITAPKNYVIAASGKLIDSQIQKELDSMADVLPQKQYPNKYFNDWIDYLDQKGIHPKQKEKICPISSPNLQTWHFSIQQANDFAWFASKMFIIKKGTITLPNKTVELQIFYHPWDDSDWVKSIEYANDGIKYYSQKLGEYPYETANIISGFHGLEIGGMGYPTLAYISTEERGKDLDATIAHEFGHNWFYGVLANNGRDHPWMDEGMNTFYQESYIAQKYPIDTANLMGFIAKKGLGNSEKIIWETYKRMHLGQSIDQPAENFTKYNYGLTVYGRTSYWMKDLKGYMGAQSFENGMKSYYIQWKYRHPTPNDFKNVMEKEGGKSLDSIFYQLKNVEPKNVTKSSPPKSLRITGLFSLKETNRYNYISLFPLLGYNAYDKWMLGGIIHNYQLPQNKFQFVAIPLFSPNLSTINVLANFDYHWFPQKLFYKVNVGTSVSKFSTNLSTDIDGNKIFTNTQKFAPYFKLYFKQKDLFSTQKIWIDVRSFFIREESFGNYAQSPFDSSYHPTSVFKTIYYVNQYTLNLNNTRSLYPYDAQLQFQQADNFYKATFTGHYFFNYRSPKEGLLLRLFAGKFFYAGQQTYTKQYETDRYQLNLSAPKGYNDYTYSNYFIGRNEFDGVKSQQIMERDGFFKVNTDLYSNKIGHTDDWLASINLNGNIPRAINPLSIFPFTIPVKFFLDIGTYADAWKDNATTGRFLYDAGLQLSLFHDVVNCYVPIFMSKVFSDYNKSILGSGYFWKTVAFSFNLQKLTAHQFIKEYPL